MGKAGDVFAMPDGARYILRTPTAETNGAYVEFEFNFPPGVFAPPPHVHRGQVEEYEVLEGQLDVLVHDEWRALRVGEGTRAFPSSSRRCGGSIPRRSKRPTPALGRLLRLRPT